MDPTSWPVLAFHSSAYIGTCLASNMGQSSPTWNGFCPSYLGCSAGTGTQLFLSMKPLASNTSSVEWDQFGCEYSLNQVHIAGFSAAEFISRATSLSAASLTSPSANAETDACIN